MNHQAIIDQLTSLAPKLKEASSPEDVLIKYAQDNNWAPAQLERVGQFYNIAKTLNFMDKSASRGDSFKVLDNEAMLARYTKHKKSKKDDSCCGEPNCKHKEASDWAAWFETPTKSASEDTSEKSAIIKEEDGKFTVYSEDGSKRLSKPGTKEEAVKRLRQVEYFKKHKKANSVPNIMAAAREEGYSPYVEVQAEPEVKTAMSLVKEELAKEAHAKFEIESTDRVIFETQNELYKIANELLEMHRVTELPFSTMERDAFYCSGSSESVKKAADAIAGYFKSKGWDISRHDYTAPAPRLARDVHNALPIFKSAAEQLDLHVAALQYKQDLEKQAAGVEQKKDKKEREETSIPGGAKTPEGDKERKPKVEIEDEEEIPGGAQTPQGGKSRTGDREAPFSQGLPRGERETFISRILYPKEEKESPTSIDADKVKGVAKNIMDIYNPATYMSQQQQQFINNLIKPPSLPTSNKRQKSVDMATKDVGRVATLQRLMLSDPIIGEADPETVISLYNTLAKANPEIVSDANLLRFALREAIQYEAVPLHTYKDLISMGKDRADTENKQMQIDSRRYSLSPDSDPKIRE